MSAGVKSIGVRVFDTLGNLKPEPEDGREAESPLAGGTEAIAVGTGVGLTSVYRAQVLLCRMRSCPGFRPASGGSTGVVLGLRQVVNLLGLAPESPLRR